MVPLRFVLDTNVLVTALRSSKGASGALVRAALQGRLRSAVSTSLFMEYEAVLKRPEHLAAAQLTPLQIDAVLNAIAAASEPVPIHYTTRPILRDPGDEHVLETALNSGAPLVTANTRDFAPALRIFALEVMSPIAALRRMLDERS